MAKVEEEPTGGMKLGRLHNRCGQFPSILSLSVGMMSDEGGSPFVGLEFVSEANSDVLRRHSAAEERGWGQRSEAWREWHCH